jgi:hypothetical protein
LFKASFKVDWDCAHSHLLARIAPDIAQLVPSFKGPPRRHTLSASNVKRPGFRSTRKAFRPLTGRAQAYVDLEASLKVVRYGYAAENNHAGLSLLASLVAPLLGPPKHPVQTGRLHAQSPSDRRAAYTLFIKYESPISLFRAEVPVLLDHPAIDETIAGRASRDIPRLY